MTFTLIIIAVVFVSAMVIAVPRGKRWSSLQQALFKKDESDDDLGGLV